MADTDRDGAEIGRRIKDVRQRRGITQMWLADKVGITKQAMYAIEAGKATPKAPHVARIARLLRVSSDYLLGLKDEQIVDDRRRALVPA
jgi:DNA-binding XRE family transcriptional regulator